MYLAVLHNFGGHKERAIPVRFEFPYLLIIRDTLDVPLSIAKGAAVPMRWLPSTRRVFTDAAHYASQIIRLRLP